MLTNLDIINSVNKQLNTPLHFATLAEDLNIIHLLIDYGANPNFKNKNGDTVLDIINRKINNEKSNSNIHSDYFKNLIQIKEYLESINASTTFFTI